MGELDALRVQLWPVLPASEGPYFGVPKGETLRWILPNDRRASAAALAGWRPYAPASRLKFAAFKAMLAALGAQYVPNILALGTPEGGGALAGVPVVYIGTPGPERKAVIHLVEKGAVAAIAKLALAPGARAALAAEAAMLERLERELPDLAAPRLLRRDAERGLTLQSVLSGRPCGRAFTTAHAEYLLRLCRPGQCDLAAATEPIRAFWADAAGGPPPALLARWAQAGRGGVPRLWLHGDFAPWNLRRQGEEIAAYDWEAGQAEGLPLQDIAHFFTIQAQLFVESRPPLAAMRANRAVGLYLERLGLDWAQGQWLFAYHCLWAARAAQGRGDAEAADFLLTQFSREMAA